MKFGFGVCMKVGFGIGSVGWGILLMIVIMFFFSVMDVMVKEVVYCIDIVMVIWVCYVG